MEQNNPPKLDYTLSDAEARTRLVEEIVKQTPQDKLTPRYLEVLANYIIFAVNKQEKAKEKKEQQLQILTPNKMVTVNKREMSYQGLALQLENGEDGIFNMIRNDKNIIFKPKVEITPKDIAEMPELKKLTEAIATVEADFKTAKGKRRYALKKQIIEMRKEQYIIKNHYRPPLYTTNIMKSFNNISFDDSFSFDVDGTPINNGFISFFNPSHISALLCNYSRLKESAWGSFESDSYFLMEDFDELTGRALDPYPLYADIVLFKIDGKTNEEIQILLKQEFGQTYTPQYLSALWRKKIPKLIAETAKKEYLEWYYTNKEKGQWKKCNRCGNIKLAHPLFFSKNSTSKDGFYTICKECRNKKPPTVQRKLDLR